MSKKQSLPKWHFSAKSTFLTIDEQVYTKRRLNHLCKMAMTEKKRQRGLPRLMVSITPIGVFSLQNLIPANECYSLSN